MTNRLFSLLIPLVSTATAQSQPRTELLTPESSETWNPVPRVVSSPYPLGQEFAPPSDAIELFNGRDLNQWKSSKGEAAAWLLTDSLLIVKPGTGDIRTKRNFGDCQLHIEWRTPKSVSGSGQYRGNSGVIIQGMYELQILDSYQNFSYSNGQAGAVYKQTVPLVNASRPPGECQAYDVIFTAPRFNKDGQILIPAQLTVLHNGVLIQLHTPIQGETVSRGRPRIKPHGRGPIVLQDHREAVSFRNIWIREL